MKAIKNYDQNRELTDGEIYSKVIIFEKSLIDKQLPSKADINRYIITHEELNSLVQDMLQGKRNFTPQEFSKMLFIDECQRNRLMPHPADKLLHSITDREEGIMYNIIMENVSAEAYGFTIEYEYE